jgi:hypothetical protein
MGRGREGEIEEKETGREGQRDTYAYMYTYMYGVHNARCDFNSFRV